MNFALSQRQAGRHPVGLVVVVGLHVVLAGALLSARLVKGPSEPAPIDLRPLDPVKPVEPDRRVLPAAADRVLHPPVVAPPIIDPVEPPPDTLVVPAEPRARPDGVASAGAGRGDGPRIEPPRVTARAARIDAGAAQCRPEYPAAAARAGVTGTTRIRFSVDATGRIAGSQILQPSGATRENRMMDKAAAEALAQCPVQAGTDELGRPMGTTTDVTYVWSLN